MFDVVEKAAGARVDRPGDDDTDHVEDQEPPERAHGGPGHRDGCAVSFGDEEGAVGCDRRGKGHDRAGFHGDLPLALFSIKMRHQARNFSSHDHRDHLEGRRVADTGQEEQRHEAGEEADEGAEPEEADHAEGGRYHRRKGPEGHATTAEPVRDPAGRGAAQRPHKRPEEHVAQGVDFGEGQLGQQRETRRVADEAAEGAGVKDAHQPVVLAAEDHRLIGEAGARIGDVAHAQPGRDGRCEDEGHPDEAGVLHPKLPTVRQGHGLAADGPKHTRRDDDGHKKLHDRHAEVSKPRIQRQCVAFFGLREEIADIGHRRGEVAATKTTE